MRYTKLFALPLAILTSLSAVTQAYAVMPQENIVTLGDSYLANPTEQDTQESLVRSMLGLRIPPGRVVEDNDRLGGERSNIDSCPKGELDLSIPKQLSVKTNTRVYDYSCASTRLYTPGENNWILLERIKLAIEEGALNERTTMVPILVGFNDTYQVDNVVAQRADRERMFVAAIDEAIATIRSVAPKTRIVLMSYPSISEPGTARQCLIHTENLVTGVPAIWIEEGELDTRDFMDDAHKRNKTEFLDLYTLTYGRGECSPDDERIIAGVYDTQTPPYNLGAHMNTRGVELVSNKLTDIYYAKHKR